MVFIENLLFSVKRKFWFEEIDFSDIEFEMGFRVVGIRLEFVCREFWWVGRLFGFRFLLGRIG